VEPETDHSPVSNEEDENKWIYYYAFPYAFMASQGQILALQKPKIISHAHTRLQVFGKSNEFNSIRKDTNYKHRRVTYNNRYESRQDFVIFKSDVIYIYMPVFLLP